jgi:imidazoleglycerol-phosphate dehydratase
VGYGLAQPPLAEALDALRPPGSISSWSAAVAELACHETEELRSRCAGIVAERDWLAERMREAGIEVAAQAGNFVLARKPVPDLFEQLVARQCAVRTFAHEAALADFFRVTVSRRDANTRLLRALAGIAGGEAPETEEFVRGRRHGEVHRATRETRIDLRLGLLGGGHARIATGLGFLDHMLTSFAFWSLTDIELRCHGDLWVDEHHTVEDCAIALGEAFDQALGDRAAVRRFGAARAPLDEALAEATVDLSGRGIAVLDLALAAPTIGRMPSTLIPHFFDSFARRGRLGLHVTATGQDAHHVSEAAFKAVALALREAVEPDPARDGIASTKGVL